MMHVEFEWDNDKAARNLRKHGVSFVQATLAFRDPLAIEWLDDRAEYGEDRIVLVGNSEGQLLTIAYAERADRIRMISARRATKDEQEYYYSQSAF